jgi:PBP1b-binding outer membrane lipoprotein LpoB
VLLSLGNEIGEKMKKTLIFIFIMMVFSGCGKKDDVEPAIQPAKESVKEAVSQEPVKEDVPQQSAEEAAPQPPINPWAISQSLDKATGEKTILLRGDLADTSVPLV